MTEWHPFETAPEDRSILVFQKAQDDHGIEGFHAEYMIIGTIKRVHHQSGGFSLFIRPDAVSGYEWECEVSVPTHWAECPDKPA